ncbi:conjugative transposon protein TraM [Flagellimonas pacifica]|uniref:Conjugative transposon TraM C-terminal domain-containing protein n=1 Tax=Flagellimonas pacifica TaxID=1247520 RepID=A0A285MX92_9FLAO|nr:conjugative transposon protein TraM [Allomuricauda parva]SNZ01303.1 Protein of unknown function [Allomuricauda parva]
MNARGNTSVNEDGYNNFLPDQENELKVQEPNVYYKKSQRDSLDRLRSKGHINNIVGAKKENDSLERILEELNNFSLDGNSSDSEDSGNATVLSPKKERSKYVDQKSEAQQQLEYRNMLLKARKERRAQSQDYSAPASTNSNSKVPILEININAAVYRDQFVLPGDRVTLILREDVVLKGTKFPKNTFVYATANIQQSRILLDIDNIDHVKIDLTARDEEDGGIGMHNKRAGELWMEFSSDIQTGGVDDISGELSNNTDIPLAKNAIRAFGNFFKKKKYKQRDKILLINGHKVYLVSK